MDPKDLFTLCTEYATTMIEAVTPADYQRATPDTEWSVRDLVGHVLYELSWTTDIVEGKTTEEVGDAYDGDLIGKNLTVSWHEALERAHDAVDLADLDGPANLSYGTVTVADYLRQAAADQLIHAWDLGTALGHRVHLPEHAVAEVYDYTLPRKQEMAASGLFDDPVEVPDDAPLQQKLLALYGREA